MIKLLLAFIFSIGFILSFAPFQKLNAQYCNKKKLTVEQEAECRFYVGEILQQDFRAVEAVVYVNIKERKLIDSVGGENVDCENDKGGGYCLYLLKAEVKEVFKGKIQSRNIEFYTSPDADYPKKNLLGERVVFLEKTVDEKIGKIKYAVLENSTRWIKYDILKSLRILARKSSNRKN